jgi:hypothetical protein
MSDITNDQTPEQREYWKGERIEDVGLTFIKQAIAKPKLAVDPLAPVQLPDT